MLITDDLSEPTNISVTFIQTFLTKGQDRIPFSAHF